MSKTHVNISEAAKLTALSSKTIRDYEEKGLISAPKRLENGYRIYSEKNLSELQFIQQARQVGFSLKEIHALLQLWRQPNRKSSVVKNMVLVHIERLDQQIKDLKNMRNTLADWAQLCQGNDGSECAILDSLTNTCKTHTKTS